MAKTSPFFSSKLHRYYDNTSCTDGNEIEPENLRQGQGGRPLCNQCNGNALGDRLSLAAEVSSHNASLGTTRPPRPWQLRRS
jgi:hypothetical protein